MTPEDIKRINYILYTSFRSFVKNPPNLVTCYALFFMKLVVSVLCFRFRYKTISELLVVVPSSNNKKSVRTIIENIPSECLSIWGNFRKDLPFALFYLRSVKGLPTFQKLYNSSNEEDKKLIRQYYYDFMSTYGIYATFDKILRRNPQLKIMLFSNDHITICRCLIELSEKYPVKTLYVQHASVTERFPSLRFTYSFLDGLESFEKYQKIGGMKGDVFLSGSPRFDELYAYKQSTRTHEIGVSLGLFDSCEMALSLCQYLQGHVSSRILVRPHPRMGKQFDRQTFEKNGFDISDSTRESSFSFLSKIKTLIANESGIHLDAALMGTPSLFFNFSKEEVKDWYSYIKNGVVPVCEKYEDLLKALERQREIPVDKIRYYNASFQTSIEGHVGHFISEFIMRVLNESETEAFQDMMKVMEKKEEYFKLKESVSNFK